MNAFDVAPAACKEAGCLGCAIHGSAEEVAQKSDFIITMLPNNDIVMDTYEKMVQNGVKSEQMFIDSSTIDPNVAKKVFLSFFPSTGLMVDMRYDMNALYLNEYIQFEQFKFWLQVQKLVKSKGASFVDAPVSGGVVGAENGTLTFMVGGTEAEYNTVKDVLECMGKRITHCGDYGMGQAAKLCNNMMLGISMIGVCETMNLAIRYSFTFVPQCSLRKEIRSIFNISISHFRLGLDPKTFNDIINSSTGRCWSSEVNNPVPGMSANCPANNDYKGGFSTALITKVRNIYANINII